MPKVWTHRPHWHFVRGSQPGYLKNQQTIAPNKTVHLTMAKKLMKSLWKMTLSKTECRQQQFALTILQVWNTNLDATRAVDLDLT